MALNLTINAKNQLKWHGTKDELTSFLTERIHRSTWAAENVNFDTTFNGTLAVYKLDGLTLNFYVSIKTLQVQGRLKDKFIEDIKGGITESGTQGPAEEEHVQVVNQDGDHQGEAEVDVITAELDNKELSSHSSCACEAPPSPTDFISFSEFSKEMQKIWCEVKFIREKYNLIVQPKNYHANLQQIETLQQRNQELFEEISILKERLSNETNMLKKVFEERDSYKTALELISREINNQRSGDFVEHASNNHRESHFVEQSQKRKNRRKAQVNKGTNRTRQASQQSVPTKKSFEPLQQNGSREPTSVEPTSTNTTVIIGDSMIKRVQGWKIARKVGYRVVVKAFPGATTSDMEHYLKPALAKDPRRVILHVGTNDLKSNLRPNPNQIADSIVDLARMIESESEAEVIISEVITRSDKTPEDHIRTVNKLLSRYCNQNGWQLLRHNNISKDHLNDGGLHLNDQGVSVLVTNLTRFLSE